MPISDHPEPADQPADRPERTERSERTKPPATADLSRWRVVGFVLLLGEALVPIGVALWALAIIVTGRAVVVRNDLLVGLLMLITGLGLLLVAARVREGRAGIRVAALLWQALLVLAVGGPLWQSGHQLLSAVVVVWAVATGVATVRATSEDAR